MTKETKTAIVTGASRGIGKAVAIELASLGYNLGILSRNRDIHEFARELKESHGIDCLSYTCDVADPHRVMEVFSDIDKNLGLEVLVNNAGINSRRTINVNDPENYLKELPKNLSGFISELQTNLLGTYICSYIAAGFMAKKKYGSIVNISSVKGLEPTTSPGYGASKAGVIKLTRDFAKALAPHNIRVNCISPGFIEAGLTQELSQEKQAVYKKQIPQGRFGKVEEIAKVVAFLISDNASYITGQTLGVNGGYLMH